jgi:predicted RNase H-like HicB family nuclease
MPGGDGPFCGSPEYSSRLWHANYFLDYNSHMITLSVELEQEEDGRWIAEVTELPGVLAYSDSPGDARARAQALALRVFADRLDHGETGPELLSISFKAA